MTRLVAWLVYACLVPSVALAQARDLSPPTPPRASSVAQATDQERPMPPRPEPHGPFFGAPARGAMRASAQWDSFLYVGSPYPYDAQVTQLANELTLALDFGSALVRGILPFAYANAPDAFIDHAETGNAAIEGYANVALGVEHRLLLGGGVVMPTGTDPNCYRLCTQQGMAVRTRAWQIAFRDGALWADETVTIVPRIDYTLGIPWFLLHAVLSVPIFFPIDPDVGGPQPAARGAVDVMPELDLSVALRIEHWVAIGASFLGWVILGVNDHTPTHVEMIGGGLVIPSPDVGQFWQGAITAFVRTDPELDAPIGGALELIYDLWSWHTNAESDSHLGKVWSIRASIHGQFEMTL